MLIDFRVKNFRSIQGEQLLSMVASSQKEFRNTHTFEPPTLKKLSLLKSVAIYGGNAAGKSNVLRAIYTMRNIVRDSATRYQRGESLPIQPFIFDKEVNEPTEFEVNFMYNEVRYQYGFATTDERITEEWLIVYPKGRAQNWFAREYNEKDNKYSWQFGDKLSGPKQLWQESTRSNALLLSTAVQLNSEQLKPIFDWFTDKLIITTGFDGWSSGHTLSKCLDENSKKLVLQFLKTADIDIEDIEVEIDTFDPELELDDIPLNQREKVASLKGVKVFKEPQFFYMGNDGKRVGLALKEESDGTRKLFSFIAPWLHSLEHGNVLVIDELHAYFHPLMVKFLIELFHNTDINTSNAQLLFTTHETSVLSQDIFRRDQVWFCEKENKATRLYPLTDFSPRKSVEDLEKWYLSGRYGALPFFQDIYMRK